MGESMCGCRETQPCESRIIVELTEVMLDKNETLSNGTTNP
jgi:hypothetical protein